VIRRGVFILTGSGVGVFILAGSGVGVFILTCSGLGGFSMKVTITEKKKKKRILYSVK
jgi:hypothetical protein